jgi:hypothetical protein
LFHKNLANPTTETFFGSLKKNAILTHVLLVLHWSALGQIKHSSGIVPGGKAFRAPLKWAHFAGESSTVGYSVGLTPTTLLSCIVISSFDMQCGHA